jgi:hypothetical protein
VELLSTLYNDLQRIFAEKFGDEFVLHEKLHNEVDLLKGRKKTRKTKTKEAWRK